MSRIQQLILRLNLQKMFYAVAKGRKIGIFNTWPECQAQITGFAGPKFKKFETRDEAQAFISQHSSIRVEESDVKPSRIQHTNNTNGESNDLRQEVLGLKTAIRNMKQKFDEFVRQQSAAIEAFEAQTDTVLLAIEGSSSGSGSFSDRWDSGMSPPAKKSKSTILLDEVPDANPKIPAKNDKGFHVDEDGFIHVYTDGACSKNGQIGAKAGYGIWWAKDHELNQSEVADRNTNNAAEIQAVTETIKLAKLHDMKKILVHTDSNFLIDCVTKWMKNWKKNGWMTAKKEPVKNRVELEALDEALEMSPRVLVKYKHVRGHCGIVGNEEADSLAVLGAQK